MLHYYDSSTDSVATQCRRLAPALAITKASIPCMVWAEDALSFVYFVPTSLFALQLIVPDNQLEQATLAITNTLPYTRMIDPPSSWLEFKIVDPTLPSACPWSIYLKNSTPTNQIHEDDPVDIYLHPQSSFYFDVQDHSRTVTLASSLPPQYSEIRFPSRTAFFDALLNTALDPPTGLRVYNYTRQLSVLFGYLVTYTLRQSPHVLPDGQLERECAAVRDSLREENRPAFERRLQPGQMSGWDDEVRVRREVLMRAGQFDQANRTRLNTAHHRASQRNTPPPSTGFRSFSTSRPCYPSHNKPSGLRLPVQRATRAVICALARKG